jgi:hypothetical protein
MLVKNATVLPGLPEIHPSLYLQIQWIRSPASGFREETNL